MRRNPTPKLKKVRAIAAAWINKYGWRGAMDRAYRVERERDFRHGKLISRTLWRIRDAEAIKPNKEQSKKIVPHKKTVRVTQAMYARLLEEHGTADPMSVRGFILEDGTCLNLGQYDDHRIINGCYADSQAAENRYGSRHGAMAHLCKKFNMIRWMPERGYVEVFVPTTRYQDDAMRDLADAGSLKEAEVHAPRRGCVLLEAEDGETLVRGINALFR
jgi:hypothetical protein